MRKSVINSKFFFSLPPQLNAMMIKKSNQKGNKLFNNSEFQICYFQLYFGLEILEKGCNFAVLK
jgi:hypothetical protein